MKDNIKWMADFCSKGGFVQCSSQHRGSLALEAPPSSGYDGFSFQGCGLSQAIQKVRFAGYLTSAEGRLGVSNDQSYTSFHLPLTFQIEGESSIETPLEAMREPVWSVSDALTDAPNWFFLVLSLSSTPPARIQRGAKQLGLCPDGTHHRMNG